MDIRGVKEQGAEGPRFQINNGCLSFPESCVHLGLGGSRTGYSINPARILFGTMPTQEKMGESCPLRWKSELSRGGGKVGGNILDGHYRRRFS